MENIYGYFVKFCIKVGVLKLELHTEKQNDDMLICVIEPRWFWRKSSNE